MKEDQRIQEEVNGHTALESSKKDFAGSSWGGELNSKGEETPRKTFSGKKEKLAVCNSEKDCLNLIRKYSNYCQQNVSLFK